jgi:glycosyltransferase involved in cell wall biosynthesis
MGYLGDEYSTMIVYNAADVFIVPSLADNQPTTVQESLCCGTPVVGFDVGGIPDMINHKENGYLAKYKDAEDVCNGVKYCLQYSLKGYMLPDFAPEVTIKKHLELISSIKNGI